MAARTILNKSQIGDIIHFYEINKDNITNIGRKLEISPKVVKRVLVESGIELTGIKGRFYRKLSNESREKISSSLKGKPSSRKGKTSKISTRKRFMENRYGLSKFSLDIFDDYEKLSFITKRWIAHGKIYDRTPEKIYNFINRFYFDEKFNVIYEMWIASDGNKWIIPTLDHKISVSNGGKDSLENFQILTWFENRAKAEMNDDEWITFKKKFNIKSGLFI